MVELYQVFALIGFLMGVIWFVWMVTSISGKSIDYVGNAHIVYDQTNYADIVNFRNSGFDYDAASADLQALLDIYNLNPLPREAREVFWRD